MNDRLYVLKIELLDIEPKIWRRFVIPGSIPLDRLHDVIQIVMGWQGYQQHEFVIGKNRYRENPEDEEEDDSKDESLFRLMDLVKQKGRTFRYFYDFGDDGWAHEITIEDSHYSHPLLRVPVVCLDGARACPPEDVGGIEGFFDFCEAVLDSTHEDHEEETEWYASFPWHNGSFDSGAYDMAKVNAELMKYLRWSRVRSLVWEMAL